MMVSHQKAHSQSGLGMRFLDDPLRVAWNQWLVTQTAHLAHLGHWPPTAPDEKMWLS